jgi:hypothetical protein
MDVSVDKTEKGLQVYNRKRNGDGSVTFTVKRQLPKSKKVVTASGKGKHTVGNVIASQVAPFKEHMRTALLKRGYNVNGVPFKEIIPLYYNEFVSNKENVKSPFVPINSFDFRNNPVWKIDLSDNLNGSFLDHQNSAFVSSINDIVENIIYVFREAKLKKEAAQRAGLKVSTVLTDEEQAQARAAQKVENSLAAKLTDSEPVKWCDVKKVLKYAFFLWLAWYIISEL